MMKSTVNGSFEESDAAVTSKRFSCMSMYAFARETSSSIATMSFPPISILLHINTYEASLHH
jgi:hypothetical protein